MTEAKAEPLYRGIPASGRLDFIAYRNVTKFGTHGLRFTRADDALTVDINIAYSVKLGFVTVFRYELLAQERWLNGETISIKAKTNNNGTTEFAAATREGAALMAEGTRAKRYAAPPGALLCAHWNMAQLQHPSINPQDGSLLRFTVTPRGPAMVPDSLGKMHGCARYDMAGENNIDLWYDAAGLWVALQAKAPDGSLITYKLAG